MPRAFLVRNHRRFAHELSLPPSKMEVDQRHLASLLFSPVASMMTQEEDVQEEPEDLSLSSAKNIKREQEQQEDDEEEPQDLSLPSSRRASSESLSNQPRSLSIRSDSSIHSSYQTLVRTTPLMLYSPATIAAFPSSLMMSPPMMSSPMSNYMKNSSICSASPQGESNASLSSPDSMDSHSCPDCGKKYSTSSNLARHRQTHRSIMDKKARKCPHCDKVYVSMPAYSMHVRTHSQGCQCKFCGKSFSRPWLLQGHIRTHTGEKPFECNICSKAFADKSNLRAHVQTHSTTKPYSCERCGKAFALKSYLYKHEESSCMRIHKRPHHHHANHQNRSHSSNDSIDFS